MRKVLCIAVTMVATFTLAGAATGAQPAAGPVAPSSVSPGSGDVPSVGDKTSLVDGQFAPLSAAELKIAGQVPVADDDGLVIATSLDSFAGTTQQRFALEDEAVQAMGIGPCNPVTGADNPHVSDGDVSGHGWWRNGTCSGDKATVRTCLLEWWRGDDGSIRWVTKKCVSKKVKAAKKGTRKPSVTARVGCTSTHYTGWANLVDVDVAGTWDNSEDGYKATNIYCRKVP